MKTYLVKIGDRYLGSFGDTVTSQRDALRIGSSVDPDNEFTPRLVTLSKRAKLRPSDDVASNPSNVAPMLRAANDSDAYPQIL